jgi:hypothetical protein
MRLDVSWMVGRTFTEITLGRYGDCSFRFGEGALIVVDCPWRIVLAGQIVLTSADHGHMYGFMTSPIDAEAQCKSLLQGLTIQSVEVREDTLDMVIRFASGARLEVLPLSSGGENWVVWAPNGDRTIAQGANRGQEQQ